MYLEALRWCVQCFASLHSWRERNSAATSLCLLRRWHFEVGGIDSLHELALFLAHCAFVTSSFSQLCERSLPGARPAEDRYDVGRGLTRLRWDEQYKEAGAAFVDWVEKKLQQQAGLLQPSFLQDDPDLLGAASCNDRPVNRRFVMWVALWHW